MTRVKGSDMDNNNPSLSMDELKGRQSVRATFRLPDEAIELLSVIASQLGIKQKTLFDQLVADQAVLKRLAAEARRTATGEADRRQKTFVISRSSLAALNGIANREHIARDVLVEFSIRRLLPVIDTELERHGKRKILLEEMRDYLRQGEKMRQKAARLLGREDRLYEMIDNQVRLCEKNVAFLDGLVEKGKPMEGWGE